MGGLGFLSRWKQDVRRQHLRRALPDHCRKRIADLLSCQGRRRDQPFVVLPREVGQVEQVIFELREPRLGSGPRRRRIRGGRRRGGGCRQWGGGERSGNR
jgi:hypothetical protein